MIPVQAVGAEAFEITHTASGFPRSAIGEGGRLKTGGVLFASGEGDDRLSGGGIDGGAQGFHRICLRERIQGRQGGSGAVPVFVEVVGEGEHTPGFLGDAGRLLFELGASSGDEGGPLIGGEVANLSGRVAANVSERARSSSTGKALDWMTK